MPCPGLGYDELSRSFNGHLLERKKCKGGLKSSLHWVEHEKQSKDIIAPAELEVFRTSRQENTSMILFYLVFSTNLVVVGIFFSQLIIIH
jgi:hypothetical protein